jgi:hypothetical protein
MKTAMAMGRLGFGGQPNYAGTQDPYYKGKSKNGIREIKMQEDLQERLNNLQAKASLVLAQVENNIKAVLLAENSSYHSAGTFASSSPYLKISQASLEAFVGLHMHLFLVCLNCGWEYARLELEYHTKKLASIQAVYQTCLQIICHRYCYLRDQKKSGWQPLAVQGLQLGNLMDQIGDSSASSDFPSALCGCMYCWSSLHSRGQANCPWSRLSSKKAQTLAKAAMQRCPP